MAKSGGRLKMSMARMLWCASHFGLMAAGGAMLPQAARAQVSEEQVQFDIPAGPMAEALRRYSEATGVQLVYSSELVEGLSSPGVSGSFSRAAALQRILVGSSLTARFSGNSATIEPLDGSGGRVLGAVRVEGAQGSPYFGGAGQAAGVNGVNGSRDITATEGTGNFTSGALTIGSKVPQALKDVPQSISVLTSERLEQQNVTDFTTALRQMPGITLVQGDSSLQTNFISRGFAVTTIQVDGGAPLMMFAPSYNDAAFFPQIDIAQYDHVELLRGAAGLLNGYGDPSGTVNLVRKKPLDHAQFNLEAQAGSWSNYRVVADATSPLALDGQLRGRLVMSYQNNHYFYDIAKDNKAMIYGIVELDATPTTLVSAGVSHTRQDSVPWLSGLPRYQSGEDLKLPRSTSIVFPWNRWNFETTEIFGTVEQKIGSEWTFKLNLTRSQQQTTRKLGSYLDGAVNPLDNSGPRLSGRYEDTGSEQFSAEAVLSGGFDLFGQRQEITIGVNRVNSDFAGLSHYQALIGSSYDAPYQPFPGGPRYCYSTSTDPAWQCPEGTIAPGTPPINIFEFDPFSPLYNEPRNPLPNDRYPSFGQIQTGAYMNLRLTAFDRLHLTTGFRWSQYKYKYVSESICHTIPATDPGFSPSCFGLQVGDIYDIARQHYSDTDISWPPPINLSFDLTKQLTAYIGYTDIYRSLANYLDADHRPLDPITGSNVEVGLKWAAREGRLNLAVSAYRIKQNGFEQMDMRYPFEGIGAASCCWLNDPNRTQKSEGIDTEVTGEILSGWQASASYTFGRTEQDGSYFGEAEGKPFRSIQPKHLYKLWTSYDFEAAGHRGLLSGLTISGGINGQSSAYYEGWVCVNPKSPPPPPGNADTCVSYGEPDYVPFSFTVPAYAVISGRIDYQFSPIWSVAVNLENIFDKTYYQTVGADPSGGNWYGAPRSLTVSLRGKW